MKLDFGPLISSIIIGLIVWNIYKNYVAPRNNKYLTFWPRFWAPTIDEIFLWFPNKIIPFLIVGLIYQETNTFNFISSLIYFINYLYSIYFHGTYGATIGKMATKVKVVDAITEGPINFRQAFLRDAIPLILSIILIISIPMNLFAGKIYAGDSKYLFMPIILAIWFLAEIFTMLTNDRRRAIHDFIAGTVVIRTNIEEIKIEQAH